MASEQKKRILVVYFSQTGQLTRVVESIIGPLEEELRIEVIRERLKPKNPYPYPWPVVRFLDVFPESVYLDPPALAPIEFDASEHFDLIILGYQPWYLSPSLPMTAFMKSETAARVMENKPVITVIACRNMWLMAQEEMKKLIAANGGRLIDNVALVDQGSPGATFITTPRWLLTGRKDGFLGLPPAGVGDAEVARARVFGERIRDRVLSQDALQGPLLADLAPCFVDPNNIASEKMGRRSFIIWGRLLRAIGPQGSPLRVPLLGLYALFLVVAIAFAVPLGALFRKVMRLNRSYRESVEKEVARLRFPYP